MTSPRYPLPTDLVALVSFDGRVYPNEAKPWDRLGPHDQGPHPLEAALEQWFSFATGKHAWVSVRGATIRGLVSARRRGKRSVWEVDCLINAAEDPGVVLSLLGRMCGDIARMGGERVFLRLSAESTILGLLRQAGFFPYARETLYRSPAPAPAEGPALPLRRRTREDAFGIYQLYSALAPASVRAIEGPTLREWLAAQEPAGGRSQELVLEEEGVIVAWARLIPGQEGRLALLVHPDYRQGDALVRAVASRLAGSRAVLCLVPSYGGAIVRPLRRQGFQPAGEYLLLAKRLAEPAAEVLPERVSTAVPVS